MWGARTKALRFDAKNISFLRSRLINLNRCMWTWRDVDELRRMSVDSFQIHRICTRNVATSNIEPLSPLQTTLFFYPKSSYFTTNVSHVYTSNCYMSSKNVHFNWFCNVTEEENMNNISISLFSCSRLMIRITLFSETVNEKFVV